MVASKRFLIDIINKKCVKALITNTQMNNLIKGRFNRQYEKFVSSGLHIYSFNIIETI
jgi:hypothetical protein